MSLIIFESDVTQLPAYIGRGEKKKGIMTVTPTLMLRYWLLMKKNYKMLVVFVA